MSILRRRPIAALLVLFIGVPLVALAHQGCSAMGAAASGPRLERMRASPHFKDGRFFNVLGHTTPGVAEFIDAWFDTDAILEPEEPMPWVKRQGAEFAGRPAPGLRVTTLGHSTLLIEIDGVRILTDPIWSERASPLSFAGPKRFHPPPMGLEELPRLDAILISHDHYDHLDADTMRRLKDLDVPMLMPLGVGAHVETWGIAAERIQEFDWWEETKIGGLRVVCTPSRHFSGRGALDRDSTLWASWSLVGPEHRMFFSGDSSMFPGFAEIGDRLGPFDLTAMESGAYNPLWRDSHLGPEQAVTAHRMLNGRVMLPIHWGTFNLAMHAWTEPVERVLAEAQKHGVTVATPRMGETVDATAVQPAARWWPEIPWQTGSDAPVVSSNLPDPLPGLDRSGAGPTNVAR